MKEKIHGRGIILAGVFANPIRRKNCRIGTELIEKTHTHLGESGGKKYDPMQWALGCYDRKEVAAGRMTDQNYIVGVLRDRLENDLRIAASFSFWLMRGQLGTGPSDVRASLVQVPADPSSGHPG